MVVCSCMLVVVCLHHHLPLIRTSPICTVRSRMSSSLSVPLSLPLSISSLLIPHHDNTTAFVIRSSVFGLFSTHTSSKKCTVNLAATYPQLELVETTRPTIPPPWSESGRSKSTPLSLIRPAHGPRITTSLRNYMIVHIPVQSRPELRL